MTHASLLIYGHFPGDSFPKWIVQRAQLLSLSGWVRSRGPNLIETHVSGHQVLVDAFEAACSLGPMDVIVDSIDVQPLEHSQFDPGFRIS